MISHIVKGFAALLAVSSWAWAATYTEANNGDLSNNRAAPTTFNLAMGANTLTATTGGGTNDEEYFKIVIPAMHNLASITLSTYSSATAASFIGVQSGNTFTVAPANATGAEMLGYTLFGKSANALVKVNGNILAALPAGGGGGMAPTGFTPPLPVGNNYTFWIQELGANVTYTLTFNVQLNAAAQAPVIAPTSGTFFDSVDVSMTTATAGASIYYTTDGSTPTTASAKYTMPFTLTSSATVKAMAHDGVLADSIVTTETFTIKPSPVTVTPAPTLAVAGKKSIKTTKASVKIKGAATNATSVTYKVGKGGAKAAVGTTAWSFNAKLKPGKNLITIQAAGAGGISIPAKVTVTYLKAN